MQALLSNPRTRARLQQDLKLPPERLERLPVETYDGETPNPLVHIPIDDPEVPPVLGPLPASVEDLDWDAGVHISPCLGGPTYHQDGKDWTVGVMFGKHIYATPSMTIPDQAEYDCCFIGPQSEALFVVELPTGGASYMISARFVPVWASQAQQTQSTGSLQTFIDNDGISIEMIDREGPHPMALSVLPDASGVCGYLTFHAMHIDFPRKLPQMRHTTNVIRVTTDSQLLLGGITLTRLWP